LSTSRGLTSHTRLVFLIPLLLTFLLGLALRLCELDADSLWLDEVFTATTAQKDLGSIPRFLATSDSHPPLHFSMAKLGETVWGSSEFIFRLPDALLGATSILLIYKVGEILWGPKEGLIAAFLLSVNPFHIRYSQEARNYSPMVFFALLSLIFLLLALRRGQKRMWFLFAVSAALNLYTHNFAFLALAAEALFAAWVIVEGWLSVKNLRLQTTLESGRAAGGDDQSSAVKHQSPPSGVVAARRQGVCLIGALALVGALYLPWLPFFYEQVFGRVIRFTGLGLGEPRGTQFSISFFADTLQTYMGASGAFLLLFVALFALGLATSRARYIVLAVLWILPPILFPFVARSGHFFNPRHAIGVVPLLLVPAARGTSVLIDWLAQRLPVAREHKHLSIVVVSILTLSAFGANSLAPIREYYLEQKTDYRSVASYLAARLRPGDLILADGVENATGTEADWTKLCLSYYLGSAQVEQTPVLAVRRGMWTDLQGTVQPQGEVVAVLAHRSRPATWDDQTEVVILDYEDISVIELRQPTGEIMQDAKAMLQAAIRLLPTFGARFDVRMALAETCTRMGLFAEAATQVVLAGLDMPGGPSPAEDLAQTISQLHPYLHVQTEDIRVGDSLSLRGYSEQPTTLLAGDVITITLWWETTAQMVTDYTTFVHFVGPDGSIVAQEDRQLRSRRRPTSSWRVGELATDVHTLELPSDVELGEYVIRTGVYYWQTGERLPARDRQGTRLPEGAIELAPVAVYSSGDDD